MGNIIVYTGNGGGKTTTALGIALRMVGHKRNVIIIQFLTWWKNIGEYRIRKMLSPYYKIFQFGRNEWVGLKSEQKKIGNRFVNIKKLEEVDKKIAKRGLEFAKRILQKEKPHLLILDEICLALHWGLLDINEVIEILDNAPKRTNIILTGRYAPEELIKRADFVNIIVESKSIVKNLCIKGLQY